MRPAAARMGNIDAIISLRLVTRCVKKTMYRGTIFPRCCGLFVTCCICDIVAIQFLCICCYEREAFFVAGLASIGNEGCLAPLPAGGAPLRRRVYICDHYILYI
jgi:hypothetical protein